MCQAKQLAFSQGCQSSTTHSAHSSPVHASFVLGTPRPAISHRAPSTDLVVFCMWPMQFVKRAFKGEEEDN